MVRLYTVIKFKLFLNFIALNIYIYLIGSFEKINCFCYVVNPWIIVILILFKQESNSIIY
jgi:hypothetical protein